MRHKLLSSLLALIFFGGGAAPGLASPAQYRAEPAAAPASERVVVRDLVWKCGPAGCVTVQRGSRPAVDCSALAREIGTLRSFAVAGEPLAPEALEKCNARAR